MNFQVKVPGDQISKGRKQIAYRGIDIFLSNKNIDWDTHDLLIIALKKPSEKDLTPRGLDVQLDSPIVVGQN